MKISIDTTETFQKATRHFTIKSDNQFKIPSIGLIQSWKFLNKENETLNPFLIFGNFELQIKQIDSTFTDTIDIAKIRQYIRQIDFPESEDEIKLSQLEHFMCGQQIKSIQYYHSVPSSELFNCLFTSEMNVYIELRNSSNETITDDFQIEETYWEKKVPSKNSSNEQTNPISKNVNKNSN